MVLGIPHIGDMPRHVQTPDRHLLNSIVDQHNATLATYVEKWSTLHPKADVLLVNTAEILDKVTLNPAEYGFSNATDACISVSYPMFGALTNAPYANNYALEYTQVLHYKDSQFAGGQKNYSLCDAPEHYVFWDDVHYTTKVHVQLALGVCHAMKTHGYDVDCSKERARS